MVALICGVSRSLLGIHFNLFLLFVFILFVFAGRVLCSRGLSMRDENNEYMLITSIKPSRSKYQERVNSNDYGRDHGFIIKGALLTAAAVTTMPTSNPIHDDSTPQSTNRPANAIQVTLCKDAIRTWCPTAGSLHTCSVHLECCLIVCCCFALLSWDGILYY